MAENSSGWEGWPSRTGSSCTARTPGPARSGTPDGRLEVASELKRYRSAGVTNLLFRGPARLAEAIALLPQVRRRLPEARLPFERPRVLTAMVAGAVATQSLAARAASARLPRSSSPRSRRSRRLRLRCASSELAAYHGAEHITIGTYEHGEAAREGARALRLAPDRARCSGRSRSATRSPPARPRSSGSPLAGSRRSAPSPPRPRSSPGWFAIPSTRVSRALARPGHELQHRLATAEPTPEQLEVAEAALAACLELEHARRQLERAGSRPRSSTCRSRRCATATTPTRTSTTPARRSSRTAAARGW